MDMEGSKEQEKPTHHMNHLNYHITVKIPQKPLQNVQNNLQSSPQQSQVSILPLQSARVVTLGSKKRRINSQVKFIHVGEEGLVSPSNKTRIGKIKNVVFRPKLQKFISEEKSRLAALEETMMFQRERRLNKQECIKKIQRLMSPSYIKQRNHKKFTRSDDKKNDENKKFKRIKDKQEPTQEQKLLQAKLIKKLREEEHNNKGLSRIAQHLDENYTQTFIQPSNPQLEMPQVFSQAAQQSIIEQSPANLQISG